MQSDSYLVLVSEANSIARNLKPEQTALYAQYPTTNRSEQFPTLERACEVESPSLVKIDNTYGGNTSIFWLVVQLISVIKYTGQKFTMHQLEATAQQLRKVAYHVTMSEMAIFFDRFEQGYYCDFHGYERPNPQVITKSFQMFLTDLLEMRSHIWSMREAEQKRKEMQNARNNAVPPPPEIAKKLEKFINSFGKYERTENNPNTTETSVQASAEAQADSNAEQ